MKPRLTQRKRTAIRLVMHGDLYPTYGIRLGKRAISRAEQAGIWPRRVRIEAL